jgi:hypothetical protein
MLDESSQPATIHLPLIPTIMELTKEYFEQTLDKKLKDAVAPLATKQDVREAVEELARITNTGFEDIQQRLDVTSQIKVFERKFHKLEEALHIKL